MIRLRSNYKLVASTMVWFWKAHQIPLMQTAFFFLKKLPKFFRPGRQFKKAKYLTFFFWNVWNWIKVATLYILRLKFFLLIKIKVLFIKINSFPELKLLFKLVFFKNENTIFCLLKLTPSFFLKIPLILEFWNKIYIFKGKKKSISLSQLFLYLSLVPYLEFYKLSVLLALNSYLLL